VSFEKDNIYATKLKNKIDLNKNTLLNQFKKNVSSIGKTMTDNLSLSKSRNKEIFKETTYMQDDEIKKNYMTQIRTTIDSDKNKRNITPTTSQDFNPYKAKIADKLMANKKSAYTQSGTSLMNNLGSSLSGNIKCPVGNQGAVKNLKDELKAFIGHKNKIDIKKLNLKK
jgi:hypothetical protein